MTSASALSVSAAALVALLWAAPVSAAERFGGRDGHLLPLDRRPQTPGRLAVAPPFAPRPFDRRVYAPRPYPPRHGGPGHHRGFAGSGPGVIYSPGFVVDSGPGYVEPTDYAPPAYAYPPATSVAVAPAPPIPSVIEYPTGRYELRGDGLSFPYTWVWVPNPPPAPPAPPAVSEPAPPASPAAPAPRRSALYTWTDRDGVVHWTDDINSVPEEYRSKVQKRSL